MLKIKLGKDKSIDYKEEKNHIFINDQPWEWDIVQIAKDHYHIIKDNRSINLEVMEFNYKNKRIKLKINSSEYELEVKDKFDLLLDKLGIDQSAKNIINELKAPMPGLIHEIKVTENQEVKKGDVLLVLEAMKMENIIKPPGDGIIKSIKVKKGQSVEKGQTLINF